MQHADYVVLFKAIADETRLRIVQMLQEGELCACDILNQFQFTQPTLSYHMKILCDSALVKSHRDGAWMRYELNRETIAALGDFFSLLNASDTPQNQQ